MNGAPPYVIDTRRNVAAQTRSLFADSGGTVQSLEMALWDFGKLLAESWFIEVNSERISIRMQDGQDIEITDPSVYVALIRYMNFCGIFTINKDRTPCTCKNATATKVWELEPCALCGGIGWTLTKPASELEIPEMEMTKQ